ncbi:hypothetical protein V2J56_06225 [Georgenia sp. MJ206]|uniref:hypothetical protein n=1 Tax=Georgenia wangjunii TaxID=3117730 RepID=UPI002F26B804
MSAATAGSGASRAHDDVALVAALPAPAPEPAPAGSLTPLTPLTPLGAVDDAGWCVDGVCAVPPTA